MKNKYQMFNGEYIHRLISEKVLGRKLKRKEHVHHVDGDVPY